MREGVALTRQLGGAGALPSARDWRRNAAVYGTCAGAALLLGSLLALKTTAALLLAAAIAAAVSGILLHRHARVAPEQYVLLAVLAVTAVFGKDFSLFRIGPLYVTDFALVVASGLIAVRVALRMNDPQARVPRTFVTLVALYLAVGVFAAIHGLVNGADVFYVVRDSALAVYGGIAVIFVLAFPRMSDIRLLYRVLAWAGVASSVFTLVFLVRQGDSGGIPVAQGVYFSFFFLAVFARASQGWRVPGWQWAIAIGQLAMLTVMTTRTSWIAVIAASTVLFATSVARRRERIVGGLIALGLTGLIAILVLPGALKTQKISQNVVQAIDGIVNPGLQSYRAANASWRLSFWRYELRVATDKPLSGVGFGPGASFCFEGICDDTRLTRDATQLSGPHNSYVHVAYRTGLPGLGLLIAMIWFAVHLASRALSRARRAGQERDVMMLRLALASFTFVAVTAFFSEVLENPYIGAFFWLSLAALLVCARSVPQAGTTRLGVLPAPGESGGHA